MLNADVLRLSYHASLDVGAPSLLKFNNIFSFNLQRVVDKTDGGFFRGQFDGGSRVVVHGSAWARTNDDRTGLAEIVPGVSRPDDAYRMEMAAEHQMWLDVLAQ